VEHTSTRDEIWNDNVVANGMVIIVSRARSWWLVRARARIRSLVGISQIVQAQLGGNTYTAGAARASSCCHNFRSSRESSQ